MTMQFTKTASVDFSSRLLICLIASGFIAMSLYRNSHADFTDRRQIIVFALPTSDAGKAVQASIDALQCELVDRDTDVRFVDISDLPDSGSSPSATAGTGDTDQSTDIPARLVRLRGEGNPEFEMVLIGKDGGVKARASDPKAFESFLELIDTMPMRRAEIRSRSGTDSHCG